MVTTRITRMIREILSEPAANFFEGLFRGKSPSPAEAPNRNDATIRLRVTDDEEVALMD